MAPTFFEGHFFSIQGDAVETMTWVDYSSDLHTSALKGNGHFNVFLAFLIGHLVKARPRFCAIWEVLIVCLVLPTLTVMQFWILVIYFFAIFWKQVLVHHLDCQFWNKADQTSLIRMQQFDLKVIDVGRFSCKIKGWNLDCFFCLAICELKGDVGIFVDLAMNPCSWFCDQFKTGTSFRATFSLDEDLRWVAFLNG